MGQAHALDEMGGLGFFTARYTAVDITPDLQRLIGAIDTAFLDRAITVGVPTLRCVSRNGTSLMRIPYAPSCLREAPWVLMNLDPLHGAALFINLLGLTCLASFLRHHLNTTLDVLDGDYTWASRSLLSEEELSEPLATLYDFGHVRDSAEKYKAAVLRGPRTLLGKRTALVRSLGKPSKASVVEGALHLVLEADDPSSGLRFCRTYFLRANAVPEAGTIKTVMPMAHCPLPQASRADTTILFLLLLLLLTVDHIPQFSLGSGRRGHGGGSGTDPPSLRGAGAGSLDHPSSQVPPERPRRPPRRGRG